MYGNSCNKYRMLEKRKEKKRKKKRAGRQAAVICNIYPRFRVACPNYAAEDQSAILRLHLIALPQREREHQRRFRLFRTIFPLVVCYTWFTEVHIRQKSRLSRGNILRKRARGDGNVTRAGYKESALTRFSRETRKSRFAVRLFINPGNAQPAPFGVYTRYTKRTYGPLLAFIMISNFLWAIRTLGHEILITGYRNATNRNYPEY